MQSLEKNLSSSFVAAPYGEGEEDALYVEIWLPSHMEKEKRMPPSWLVMATPWRGEDAFFFSCLAAHMEYEEEGGCPSMDLPWGVPLLSLGGRPF